MGVSDAQGVDIAHAQNDIMYIWPLAYGASIMKRSFFGTFKAIWASFCSTFPLNKVYYQIQLWIVHFMSSLRSCFYRIAQCQG